MKFTIPKIKDERLRIAVAIIPAYVLFLILLYILDALSENDIRLILLVLVPVLAIVAILGMPLYRNKRIGLGGGWIYLFIIYCIFFALLSNTSFLSGSRIPVTATDATPPPKLFGLDIVEDWHFQLAPKTIYTDSILIIGMESVETISRRSDDVRLSPLDSLRALNKIRRGFLGILNQAILEKAKAVVFDYVMDDSSDFDTVLSRAIISAEKAKIPVCICQGLEPSKDNPDSLLLIPITPIIRKSLKDSRLGHCLMYLQSDTIMRLAPTQIKFGDDDETIVSLSQAVAGSLGNNEDTRINSDFLFINNIKSGFDTISFRGSVSKLPSFRNKIIFVGSHRVKDISKTPYGKRWGVEIHALLSSAMLANNTITYANRFVGFLIIFLSCFCLLLIQGSSKLKDPKMLLYGAVVLSIGIILLCILAIRFTNIWIDMAFPLLALWLFTLLLWRGASVKAYWNAKREDPEIADGMFDTFIFHHAADTHAVQKSLLEELETRGLKYDTYAWDSDAPEEDFDRFGDKITTANSIIAAWGHAEDGKDFFRFVQKCVNQKAGKGVPVIGVVVDGDARKVKIPRSISSQQRDVSTLSRNKIKSLKNIQWDITGCLPQPLQVFISYAHEDTAFKEQLLVSLKAIEREELIHTWNDSNLIPAQRWNKEILENLRNAHLIIFLISPDYYGSDFIAEVEEPEAWVRHLEHDVQLIPVVCRFTDWSKSKLAQFQGLPDGANPIDNWDNIGQAWLSVNKGLRKTIRIANEKRREKGDLCN